MRDVYSQSAQRWSDVQIYIDRVALQRFFVVLEVDAVPDRRVSGDGQRDDGVLVLGLHETQDIQGLDFRLHGDVVVAGFEDEVGQQGGADACAVDGEVHGDVPEIEGHDGRVGDVDFADHVGAVGQELGLAGEEFDRSNVQALEFVEAYMSVLVSCLDVMVNQTCPSLRPPCCSRRPLLGVL